jgi:hypothetical protein
MIDKGICVVAYISEKMTKTILIPKISSIAQFKKKSTHSAQLLPRGATVSWG